MQQFKQKNLYKQKKKYRLSILGLGNIGMLYDIEHSEEAFSLSHVRGFYRHPEFELVGAVDPNENLRALFTKKYKVQSWDSLENLLDHVEPEVIVVATPTADHAESVIKAISRYSPYAILCEKPLADKVDLAKAIANACSENNVSLYVNFMRRADPAVQEVRQRILSGEIKMPFRGIVWYSKGLVHNGSHFADLLSFWFGPIRNARVVNKGHLHGEPDVHMIFDQGDVFFFAANENNFSLYTIEVIATNGRLRYEHGGAIHWQAVGMHPVIKGYRQLQISSERIVDDMNHCQRNVANQLSRALNGFEHNLCLADDSIASQAWLEKLVETANHL